MYKLRVDAISRSPLAEKVRVTLGPILTAPTGGLGSGEAIPGGANNDVVGGSIVVDWNADDHPMIDDEVEIKLSSARSKSSK